MKITDFANGTPWLMARSELEAMLRTLPDPIAESTLETLAANFTPDPKKRDDFMLRDGVAIIPITGALSKRRSFWSYFFGGASLADLTDVFMDALEDTAVEAILLDIDSPGGTVAGTDAFSSLVYGARGKKPCVAFANGNMASCAYWIGSAADKIITESTAQVGSIGVYTIHTDYSEMDKAEGIKRTVVKAGKYKAIGEEPLTAEREKILQNHVDYLYSMFVNTVARNLGIAADTVNSDLADGRVFIGRQAVDAGLAHAVGTMDTAIETAHELIEARGPKLYTFNNRAVSAQSQEDVMSKDLKAVDPATITTVALLGEVFPDLVAQIQEAAKAEIDSDKIAAEAAEGEKRRIMGLVKAHFGDDSGDKFDAIVATDITVDQYKAIVGDKPPAAQSSAEAAAILKAKDDALKAIEAAGADNPGGGDGTPAGDKGFMALVEEYESIHKTGKTAAMQAVMKKHPEVHKAYIASVN